MPVLCPFWYTFPEDIRTFYVDTQRLFGLSIFKLQASSSGLALECYPATVQEVARAHSQLTGADFVDISAAIPGGAIP